MKNLKNWDTAHCCAMFGAGILFWFTGWKMAIPIVISLSVLLLLISEWSPLKKITPFAGYANWVTFFRLIGTLMVFSISESIDDKQIAILLLILISLDGLDGFLARRFNQTTDFGAFLDMETDSIFVCLTSILLFEKGLVNGWILLIGFLRYIYVVLIYCLRMHNLPEKRTKFGPTIAVILFVAVIVPFVLQPRIYIPFLIEASVLVCLSFMWSFYLLIVEKHKLS